MSRKPKQYLNGPDLVKEIYKSRELGELTPTALKMLMKLAKKVITKNYYVCEADREDALSEAYFDIIKYWKSFDPDYAKHNGYELLEPGMEIRVKSPDFEGKLVHAFVVENFVKDKKIKLSYKSLNNEYQEAIFDKIDIVIKDPNAFSFFTSMCINGFSKGFKRIYPNNAKGVMISYHSGEDSSCSGFHSM